MLAVAVVPVIAAVRVSMMIPEITPPGTANELAMATGDVVGAGEPAADAVHEHVGSAARRRRR